MHLGSFGFVPGCSRVRIYYNCKNVTVNVQLLHQSSVPFSLNLQNKLALVLIFSDEGLVLKTRESFDYRIYDLLT